MFFLHNWTSPVSKLVRFFITARVLFGTSPFSSQLAASCCEHVSLLFNWTYRVSNKSFFLRNWAPCFEDVSLLRNCTRPGSNNSFFFATDRVLFRTSVVWPQFDASGRNPGRELRNSGESAARSDDPSSPFSPRRPLNGGWCPKNEKRPIFGTACINPLKLQTSGFRKGFTHEMGPISGTLCIIRVKSKQLKMKENRIRPVWPPPCAQENVWKHTEHQTACSILNERK